ALAASAFEPIVMAAVHLHHRSEARTAFPTLAMASTSPTPLPQPACFEQRRERIGAQCQPIACQLFACESGTEIGVTFLVQLHHAIHHVRTEPAVACPPTQPMHQPFISTVLEPLPHPPGMTQ